MATPFVPGCEQGFHPPLVAREPVPHDGCVNVDWVCPACGAHQYTMSWTDEAWREHLEKERTKAEKAARRGGAR